MVLCRDLELARKSDPNPDPAGAPGMCLHGGQASRPFWVSVMNPVFENGELVLEFSFKNPCNQGSSNFSREEARPLGYLGEFLFSVHVHINQPQLSQRDWKLLNKWLLGARLDDLKALSPAFKQAVLDWARAMPSLIVGQNRVPEGEPGVTDDGWRRWTHDAINKLMSQYQRPLGSLPHQIMACLKQAHYTLGAGGFDGEGSTGFGRPSVSRPPARSLEPPTPQLTNSSTTGSDKRPRGSQGRSNSQTRTHSTAPNLAAKSPASPSEYASTLNSPADSFLEQRQDTESRTGARQDGVRRSARTRASQHAAGLRRPFPSKDFSDISEESLAAFEPCEDADMALQACFTTSHQGNEARGSLDSDAGQGSQVLLGGLGRQAIQRSSGGVTIAGNASWVGCRLPPDLLDISAEAFPAFKRQRTIWAGPPASALELHKTLDHLENNRMAFADVAGDAPQAATLSDHLDDLFGLKGPSALIANAAASADPAGPLDLAGSDLPPSIQLTSPYAGDQLTGTDASPGMNGSSYGNPSTLQETGPTYRSSWPLPAVHGAGEQGATGGDGRGPWHHGPPIHSELTTKWSQTCTKIDDLELPHPTDFDPFGDILDGGFLEPLPSAPAVPPTAPSPPLRLHLQQLSDRQPQRGLEGYLRLSSPQAPSPLPLEVGARMGSGISRHHDIGRRPPRNAATPPGFGSRVVSGCMTSAAMAAHEELMGLPLVSGPRTRSIASPIVRQGPAILRSRPKSTGPACLASPNTQHIMFQEPRRHSSASMGASDMWLAQATTRQGLQEELQHRGSHPLSGLELEADPFSPRHSSLSWGTVEAIAAGYVPGLEGE
ncbi:hypothetical protein WJX84_002808 [Apatococcus fuscideae]|uniref:Uncharacterized protein n=1 Tax=Apatococcus fuscideae TaxID=2026836 RepID=A0AAW1TBA2_9CHLO